MSQTYSYDLTFNGDEGIITVTTSSTATNDTGSGNGYDVTAISGTFDGKTITGEYGPGGKASSDDNIGPYDNTIFVDDSVGTGGSHDGVDESGIAFQTADGEYYALYTSGTNFFTQTEKVSQQPVTFDSFTPPCYCRGARLLAEHGYIAVERLQVGDGSSPRRAPFARSLGRPSRVDCRRHRAQRGMAGARRGGRLRRGSTPRDLWLSPGHSVAVDGALIPIRLLVNGRSIAQVETERSSIGTSSSTRTNSSRRRAAGRIVSRLRQPQRFRQRRRLHRSPPRFRAQRLAGDLPAARQTGAGSRQGQGAPARPPVRRGARADPRGGRACARRRAADRADLAQRDQARVRASGGLLVARLEVEYVHSGAHAGGEF